ncbi:putative ribonuclease FitB|nr:putative ribonuclease FitB [Candidatus Pantoea persica]
MRYLLDTNVIAELRKARTPAIEPTVSAWTDIVDAGDMFLSIITVMEIEKGIAQLARRDPAQAARLQTWFETAVLTEFSDRILPFDIEAARYCAACMCRISAPLTMPLSPPSPGSMIWCW